MRTNTSTVLNKDRYAGESFVALSPLSDHAARYCPACNESTSRVVGVKNDLRIVSCRNCATLYTPYHPWYSSQEFYSGYYPEILSEPEFIKKRLSVIVSSFTQYRKTNRLLDLGCGSGALLQAAIGEGWQAEGLDISPKVVEYASNLGLKVKCSELEEAGYPAGQFDVVVASELL